MDRGRLERRRSGIGPSGNVKRLMEGQRTAGGTLFPYPIEEGAERRQSMVLSPKGLYFLSEASSKVAAKGGA
jgi:hypothetical protein